MIKTRIFLIHGWSGGPDKDWLPWVKGKLEEMDYDVITPLMPNTDSPVISAWVPYLSELVGHLRTNDILIGHSIGCQTILRYLEKTNGLAHKVVLVAPWFTLTNLENDDMWRQADQWVNTPMDFSKIKPKSKEFITVFSENDPWVPYQQNMELFKKSLNPTIITLYGKGHITADEGITELPELLKYI